MRRSNSTRDGPFGNRGMNPRPLGRFGSFQGIADSSIKGHRRDDNQANDWEPSRPGGESNSFKRIGQHRGRDKHGPTKEENDYLRNICRRVQQAKDDRDEKERDEKALELLKKQESESQALVDADTPGIKPVSLEVKTQTGAQKTMVVKIKESMRVAELFYLLNDTNWNKFDEKFYLINRRWFDRWKDFIAYDYIVKQLVEFGNKENDLSMNRLLQSNVFPGEISNGQLILNRCDFLENRCEKMQFCNFCLKKDIMPERDLIFLTEPIWKTLHQIYGGVEVRRYAIHKNPASILDRSPFLPSLLVCLVIFEE